MGRSRIRETPKATKHPLARLAPANLHLLNSSSRCCLSSKKEIHITKRTKEPVLCLYIHIYIYIYIYIVIFVPRSCHGIQLQSTADQQQ